MICVENISESNVRCKIEVLKVQKKDQNCWNWTISLKIHAKNAKIGNDPWCALSSISQLLLGQNWKVRPVLNSSEQADFKNVVTF